MPLNKVFDQTVKLPTIPQVVYDLVEMTRYEKTDLSDIIDLVRRDQTIAAKVIRVANSSFYGESGRIASVERAVNLVGVQTLRTTVITSGVMSAFPQVAGISMGNYWRHGLTSAYMGAEIAGTLGVDAEEAFTAGLMQGLGVLLIQLRLPAEAKQIGTLVHPLDLAKRVSVEREILGFSHNDVTAELLLRWRFPQSVRTAIADFPEPDRAAILGKILRASSEYSWYTLSGVREELIMASLDSKLASALGLSQERLERLRGPVRDAVDAIVISS